LLSPRRSTALERRIDLRLSVAATNRTDQFLLDLDYQAPLSRPDAGASLDRS
jgi:hypothetical protein